VKRLEKVRDALLLGEEKSVVLLEGSQASLGRHSDKCRVNVKTLRCLELMIRRSCRILIF
jgi:hypothetical protein